MALKWKYTTTSCIRCLSGEYTSLACDHEGVIQTARSLALLIYFCAALILSHEMRMRLETCIICNWYHSLMVSALPLAAHNGPFLRFSASCSAFWWWQNGDSGCHLGRNEKNDGTFHLLVRKLAFLALDMMCMHVLVQRAEDRREECPSKERCTVLSWCRNKEQNEMWVSMLHVDTLATRKLL